MFSACFHVQQGCHISQLFRRSSYIPASSDENFNVNNVTLNAVQTGIVNNGSSPLPGSDRAGVTTEPVVPCHGAHRRWGTSELTGGRF